MNNLALNLYEACRLITNASLEDATQVSVEIAKLLRAPLPVTPMELQNELSDYDPRLLGAAFADADQFTSATRVGSSLATISRVHTSLVSLFHGTASAALDYLETADQEKHIYTMKGLYETFTKAMVGVATTRPISVSLGYLNAALEVSLTGQVVSISPPLEAMSIVRGELVQYEPSEVLPENHGTLPTELNIPDSPYHDPNYFWAHVMLPLLTKLFDASSKHYNPNYLLLLTTTLLRLYVTIFKLFKTYECEANGLGYYYLQSHLPHED